jgi:hypothetical protein
VPPIVHEVLRSAGQPLAAETRAFMESRFGHDFGRVRIQTPLPAMDGGELTMNQPGDLYEREADRVAEAVLNSPASPLGATTTSDQTPSRCDFGRVRIHTDPQAAEAAKTVNARAFTVGQDVVFGAGQYSLGTSAGRHLLAHELTHTLQQRWCAKGPGGTIMSQWDEAKTECSNAPAEKWIETVVVEQETPQTVSAQRLSGISESS